MFCNVMQEQKRRDYMYWVFEELQGIFHILEGSCLKIDVVFLVFNIRKVNNYHINASEA
jgi:hypothetical protein